MFTHNTLTLINMFLILAMTPSSYRFNNINNEFLKVNKIKMKKIKIKMKKKNKGNL